MRYRIILFFVIILTISASYFVLDFNETSGTENRTLKTNFDFENGFKQAVLDNEFQDQLEEILSDQILFRQEQVSLQSKITNIFGLHNTFTDGQYKYNDKTILTLEDYLNQDFSKDSYTEDYYNQVVDITNQIKEAGADFSIYYANLENYYCIITYGDECSQISASERNDNFYDANTILGNDEYAFVGGDHHLTMEAQYKMFVEIMKNFGLSSEVKDFNQYYDTSNSKVVTGSREQLAKYKFGVTGTEYAPIFDSGMTMYENGESYNVDDIYEFKSSIEVADRNYLSPGYCGENANKRRIVTETGKFYMENDKAPIDQKVLLIGDSQICGVSPFFYQTFAETHTFDYRNQMIDVVKYVEENDIDHVIYYGTKPFDTFDVWFNK